MEWRDEGILLSTARHGESGLILDVFTAQHGRRKGLLRGGASRNRAAEMQIGAQLSVQWRARLETQLGRYQAEATRMRAGHVLEDRLALAALASAAALIETLIPESDPQPSLYAESVRLFDAIASDAEWPATYARWELTLLAELGYGLDLTCCAATGVSQDLVYVSPRSGRAVSRDAGAPYHDKLLSLPNFLTLDGAPATPEEFAEALKTTGFFLEHRVAPALGVDAAPARERLQRLAVQSDPPAPD